MLQHVYVVYFSPTGRTRQTALCLAKEMAESVREIDLSLPEDFAHVFEQDDVIIFAAPVFAGRIPVYVLEKIKGCQANQARAAAVVVYGNRHYDDALLEWSNSLQASGFGLLAAAALVAEHSMLRDIAAGRPDEQDRSVLKDFAEKILIKSEKNEYGKSLNIPGNQPYVDRKQLPVVPSVSAACNECGICAAKCPVNAINQAKTQETESGKCILCMRCIDLCPQNARSLPTPALQMLEQKLAQAKAVRRDNELYC